MVKKKVKQKAKPLEKKSRAKYDCPPELSEIIAIVNLVPLNIEMKSFNSVLSQLEMEKSIRQSFSPEKTEPEVDLRIEALKKCLHNLPEDFQKYIKSYEPILKAIQLKEYGRADGLEYGLISVYESFFQRWYSVKVFTERIKRERDGEVVSWEQESLYISAKILRDEDRTEYLSGFGGLIGKFKSDRLRICKICSRVFWAKREDSETCSSRCLNAFNVRNYRRPIEKKLEQLQRELANETAKLEKLKSGLSSENKLIAEQIERVNKLKEKIKKIEVAKNGTL